MPKRTDDQPEQRARPDLVGIIRELREELAMVEDAIRTFERIAAGNPSAGDGLGSG